MVEQQQIMCVTEQAEQHLRRMCEQNHCDSVRLCLKPAGCAGFKPVWSVAESITEGDISMIFTGFRIIMQADHASVLAGSTVDYVGDFLNHNLVVIPPSGGTACGCGESISFSEDSSQ